MLTKKLQVIDYTVKQAENADTVDGKHASDFAAATDMTTAQSDISDLQTKVGNTAVSDQITASQKDMIGATSSDAGSHGLVPAPAAGQQNSFLRGDGTWAIPDGATYSVATQSEDGLMSSADKIKLDGVAEGATATTIQFVRW